MGKGKEGNIKFSPINKNPVKKSKIKNKPNYIYNTSCLHALPAYHAALVWICKYVEERRFILTS